MATWPSSLGQHGEAQGGEASAKACGDFGVSEAIEKPKGYFWKVRCFMLEISYEFILSKPFSYCSVLHQVFVGRCIRHFGGSLHRLHRKFPWTCFA